MNPRSDFARIGARRFPAALAPDVVEGLRRRADAHLRAGAGARLSADAGFQALAAGDGEIGKLAASLLDGARPVRLVLFDKTPRSNWAVGWHQDRTIAVAARREVEGFGPWSVKAGTPHVEPPFALLERMITLRVHLDDCGRDNAPLRIAPGSHRLGRIAASDAAELAAQTAPLVCEALAGDVWAYATPILHASARAVRPSRRRVLQIDYSDADLPGGLAWPGGVA